MSGLTAVLAHFVADPGIDVLSDDLLRLVKPGFIDSVATMLAGRDEPVVGVVRKFAAARRSALQESRLLFGKDHISAADAALINATAAHALDYDDVALAGHPSAVLVPAILAAGEPLGVSGMTALRAYLVGYEVWAELLSREPAPYHVKGWHPTAVLGTVGAAAAVAHLHGLNVTQVTNTLSIAASMASGLVANFGTMTKPLHAGRAAACAIDAVGLAVAGLTAAPDIFEHHAGFLAALSPSGQAERSTPAATLGRQWRLVDTGLSIKRYPMCYATHRIIDGVLAMVTEHDLRPAQIVQVYPRVGVAQASMLRNHAPVSGLEAKFSLEFAVAAAIVERRVGLRELTDACVNQSGVREMMQRVTISTTDTACPIEPVFAYTDRVELELLDGRRLDSGEIRFPKGNSKLPLSDEELKTKFYDCTADVKDIDAPALYGQLAALESLDNVCQLEHGTNEI
ncbi:MAG: MmgE/PrpD family protein [Betaproteobacteria bacterium]